jgi:multiple sugar transport system permease protein
VRRILGLLVLAPLALHLAAAVWRFGHDGRAAMGVRLVTVADSAASRVGVLLRAGIAGADSAGVTGSTAIDRVMQDLEAGGFHARWQALDRTGPSTTLPDRVMLELASVDRPFVALIGGRITGVAPVKDADQWDMLGAIAVESIPPDPPRFPPGPSLLALLVLIAAGAAAAVWMRRPSPLSIVLLLLGPTAFSIGLALTASPRTPGSGDHGLWAVAGGAGWIVIALTGLSLARIAGRPLVLGEALKAWAFLAPSFVHLLVFSIGPIVFAFWLSFHEWNLIEPARPFVGLANYRELAADHEFWRAVRNTAVFVLFVPAGMIVGLALALVANRRVPGVRLMRTVFFLPYITSFVAISLVWRWMFQPDVGLFNNLLGRVGIGPWPWLSSPATALPSLMLMSVWMYAGYMMVIFLAGLQNIPESLYESARIDGAGPWRRFIHITLPMLRPTLLFVLVTMVIFMFQVFTAVYVMTEGGPLHATDVIVYHVYRSAWEYLRMGYASAMAWVLFAVVFIITLIQFRFLDDPAGRVSR